MGIKRVSLSCSTLCSPPSTLRPTTKEPGSRTLKPILHGEPVWARRRTFLRKPSAAEAAFLLFRPSGHEPEMETDPRA